MGVDDFLSSLSLLENTKNKDTCTELCQAGFPRPGGAEAEGQACGHRQPDSRAKAAASLSEPPARLHRPWPLRWLLGWSQRVTPQDSGQALKSLADPDSSGLNVQGSLCSLLGKRIFVSFAFLSVRGALERAASTSLLCRSGSKNGKSPSQTVYLKVTHFREEGSWN